MLAFKVQLLSAIFVFLHFKIALYIFIFSQQKADLCGLLFSLKYRIACLFVCFEKLVAKGNYFVR